jgi:hypothetical protein
MHVTRTGILIRPNNARVLYRPFEPTTSSRAMKIIGRVMELPEETVERLLAGVLSEFHGRHRGFVIFSMNGSLPCGGTCSPTEP